MDKNDAVNSLKIDRDDEPQPARGRRGWIVAVIAVAVTTMAVAVGWWWYDSQPVRVRTLVVTAPAGGGRRAITC